MLIGSILFERTAKAQTVSLPNEFAYYAEANDSIIHFYAYFSLN